MKQLRKETKINVHVTLINRRTFIKYVLRFLIKWTAKCYLNFWVHLFSRAKKKSYFASTYFRECEVYENFATT